MKGPTLGFAALALKFLIWVLVLLNWLRVASSQDGQWYDSTAYTECKSHPEAPLYNGGILKGGGGEMEMRYTSTETGVASLGFALDNLTQSTRHAFSCWARIEGTDSALVKARLVTENSTLKCIGTVLAKRGCWSFLKGGFVIDKNSETAFLFFKSDDENVAEISVASASLQPFSVEQWKMHQEDNIRTRRKRVVTVHVSDSQGNRIAGASVSAQQLSRDFPIGSAIAKTILDNSAYQAWFVERFNAAVFENELKWYATEPEPGVLNYSAADRMLDFTRAHQVLVRGHNIFWEDPAYTPPWVLNLTAADLASAVRSRIDSLLSRYKSDFVHWDVSNEMLHFDFYESRLGPNASAAFFAAAREADPLATLFMNDFNVVETCNDANAAVDLYIERLREINKGGRKMLQGIGLEGHFSKPNVPLMRAVLDKLATLQLPIWLTEVDVSKKFDHQTQAYYLEEVLREGFSHPAVNGIVLWTALHPKGCYQMCLTSVDIENLPAGEVVDRLLKEWETGAKGGSTDDHGSYSFGGFLGEYRISVQYGNKSAEETVALDQGVETRHLNIQI